MLITQGGRFAGYGFGQEGFAGAGWAGHQDPFGNASA